MTAIWWEVFYNYMIINLPRSPLQKGDNPQLYLYKNFSNSPFTIACVART
ncbi:hypothetical protein HMPREF9072_01668 [Capnocytophaga sp. oral taxon 324 str. F0483]|nr:hypothetical protein HMPREF9072_01668 [Capnocytophaga sp. oral taxon 324 str. F0483]